MGNPEGCPRYKHEKDPYVTPGNGNEIFGAYYKYFYVSKKIVVYSYRYAIYFLLLVFLLLLLHFEILVVCPHRPYYVA